MKKNFKRIPDHKRLTEPSQENIKFMRNISNILDDAQDTYQHIPRETLYPAGNGDTIGQHNFHIRVFKESS